MFPEQAIYGERYPPHQEDLNLPKPFKTLAKHFDCHRFSNLPGSTNNKRLSIFRISPLLKL
jgi:hypothetical protein